MKFLLALGLAMLTQLTSASTIDSAQFLYQGISDPQMMSLATEKTHTEYRDVSVPGTCYRTEYRYRCQMRPGVCRTTCHRGHCRRVCSPPRRFCQNIPVRIPYQCTRVERQPYEVLDYFVNSNIEFMFEGKAERASETFKVTQNGDEVSLDVNSSKRYALILTDKDEAQSLSGNTKFLDIKYFIELIDIESIKASLQNGLYGVRLSNGVLSFKVGTSFDLRNFKNTIKIYKSRRLASDILLLDKVLANHEAEMTIEGNEKTIAIDLNNLGVNLPNRMRVIFETEYNFQGKTLLNSEVQEDLKASLNYIFN